MLVAMHLVKFNSTVFGKCLACDSVWHSFKLINVTILEPCSSSVDLRRIHPSYYLPMAAEKLLFIHAWLHFAHSLLYVFLSTTSMKHAV